MEPKGEENFKKKTLSNNKKHGHHPFTHSTAVNDGYNLGILIGAKKRQFLLSKNSQFSTGR